MAQEHRPTQDGRPYGSAAAAPLGNAPVADLGRSVGMTVLVTLLGLLLLLVL